jgi:hypothetical protein
MQSTAIEDDDGKRQDGLGAFRFETLLCTQSVRQSDPCTVPPAELYCRLQGRLHRAAEYPSAMCPKECHEYMIMIGLPSWTYGYRLIKDKCTEAVVELITA